MKKSILLLIAAFTTLVTSAQTKVEIDGIWYNLNDNTKQAKATRIGDDNKLFEDMNTTIRLDETAEHIKDYIALKEIWLALDGPNWSYYGEAEALGCNWDFNKDLDLWGQQPGVSIDTDGRVVSLSLVGMGAKGIVPDAIGQLTELEILSLGTHEEFLGGHLFENDSNKMTIEQKLAIRMDYHDKFLARDARESLSDILQEQINRDGKQPAIHPSNRIHLQDVALGKKTNQIKGISRAIMRLTKLQQFYIANSPITTENFFVDVKEDTAYPEFYEEQTDWSWSNLEYLTDVEIYNCSELTSLPMEMFDEDGLPELQSLNIACNNGINAETLRENWIGIIDGNSGDRLQLLYMGYNNLKEFPEHKYLSKMVKLGLLDCTNNQIETLHPFGKNVNLTKFYLDNNKITHIPGQPDGDGYKYFFGYYDMELFSCTNNQLTLVPDVFNAKSVNIMASVDFSYNQITGFENGNDHKGINAATISLSYNRLEEMPAVLFKTGSPVTTLVLSGNGMKRIPEGSMTGKYSHYLQTLDLSYNKLTDLPKDLWSNNIPYLYGIDLSYNCFIEFPYEPLDGAYLTTFGIRHQRDEQGNRTLKIWPTGLYTCPSLVAFYVGSNDLRKIEDTISPYLRYFEIKDNPNISIDLSDVCDYYRLGYNLLIYDKTQDIRGCDYLLESDDTDETEKCAIPTISYEGGKVSLACETEDAKVITTIEKGGDETREDMEFDLIPTYTLTAYATKEGWLDSETTTLTLCWIPCEENHEESDGILTIPSKPVLISTQGGTITLSGLAEGTEVAVVTTGGTAVATATATNGTATIDTSLNAGTTVIVKIGDYSVKVIVK